MSAAVFAYVRGLSAANYAEARVDVQPNLNNRGDLVVAQGLPPLAELVRLGDSWQCPSTTGQAAITSLPTTTAGLTIVNNEPSTGKTLVIDSFGSWEAVVDATQTDVTAIFAMLNKRGSTAPSGGTSELANARSLSGRTTGPNNALIARGQTVTSDGWFAHGVGGQMAPVAAGANWKVNEVAANGLYLVTPGTAFSIQAVKAAAAAAAQQFFYVRWHAVQLLYAS